MTEVQFYTIISWVWLAVTIMNLIVLIGTKKLTSGEEWSKVILPLLLFGAYGRIAQLLTDLTK